MDEMYHVCRWCHSYTRGKCWRGMPMPESNAIDWVYDIAESGELSAVLEESLNSASQEAFIQELRQKLKEWKVSERRIDEFENLFSTCMRQFLDMECMPVCDESISLLYQDGANPEKNQGIVIRDPDNFYCKYFE